MSDTAFYKIYKQSQDALLHKLDTEKSSFFVKNDIEYKHEPYGSGSIIKLKYNDHCKFTKLWQYACRGSTFIRGRTGVQSFFSLNKFFNEHEFEKYYKMTFYEYIKSLESKGFKFLYMPKYDGSNIQCFVTEDGTLHIYTLGSLEKNKIHNTEFSYYDTVHKILEKTHPKILQFLHDHIGTSMVFELISPHNVIKTKYKFDDLLGSLMPLVLINKDGIPEFFNRNELNCYIFSHWDFTSDDYDVVKKTVFSELVSAPDVYGDNPEGLVAYAYIDNMCFPISKMKREEYFRENMTDFKTLQILKLQNKLDDHILSKQESEHVELFDTYLTKIGNLFDGYDFLKTFLPLKQFTKCVENLDDKLLCYKDALFKLRRNGFEYTTGYGLVVSLLMTEVKDIILIKKLQEENGTDWFII